MRPWTGRQARQASSPEVAMDDAREEFVPKFDQEKETRVIAAHPPFLVATVELDRSEKNAISVFVSGLDHDDIELGDPRKMVAFVQVRQQEDLGPVPDQFAVSIIEVRPALGTRTVAFRIKRLDSSGGWGQRLTVQILLFAG
jgi:hypothetical protein